MPRNLDRRVEALVPVVRPELQRRLQEILGVLDLDEVCQVALGRLERGL